MQNDYKAYIASVTLDQQLVLPDFIKTSSQDAATLAVAAASYPNHNDIEDYLLNDSHNVLKVVHVQDHEHVSPKILALKRAFDVCFSMVLMVLGAPVFMLLYMITRLSSKGPAFFAQERIGKNGRPFHIYKFRSMYIDAEKFGPQLAKDNDPRITKWGRLIRKTRLDELPQFWNVLKGDMTIVGPRPERQYYIDKIVQRNPDYRKLQKLKPGITSIGQVEYGYAENIEEMCNRLHYDLLYLDDMSLNSDIQIICRTVRVMVQKKGK